MTGPAWLARYATRVAVRRVVTILVLSLLAWVGIGRAEAQAEPRRCDNQSRCTIEEAVARVQWDMRNACSVQGLEFEYDRKRVRGRYQQWIGTTCGPGGASATAWIVWMEECPAGSNWDEDSMTCTTECGSDAWPDPLNPGQCLTDQKCRERNSGMSLGSGLQTRPYGSKCLGGCEYAVAPGTGITSTVIGGETLYSGEYEWTGGGTCAAAPPAPPADEPKAPREHCTAIPGSDMTRCMRNDGSTCVSVNGGAQICWKPGETGQKAYENIAQVANAGDQPIPPPNLNLPNGDALEPKGPPVNVTTVNNATNTIINTTVQNYQTVNGTNPGGNDGTPKPGEPGYKPPGPDGPSDGKGEDGSASGGGDCDTSPVVSDPMLGMVATQAWATRCAVEAGNTAKVTGDVGDCSAPFEVEGTNANAQQLRAMRAQICGAEERDEYAKGEREDDANRLDSEADAMTEEFGENIFADEGDGSGVSFDTGWFSAGGGQCPDISAQLPSWAGGATWTPPPQFCQSLAWLSLLFQAIAMVWGIRIVMGR